jgi:hypothetical protein
MRGSVPRIQSACDSHSALYRKEGTRMRRYPLAVPMLIVTGLVSTVTAHAESAEPFRFNLVATSTTCFSSASAKVTVLPKEEDRGVDTLDLKAEGLPPNTSFTVFLTELAEFPFGASEYIA